jgi:hypothetical protein
MRQSYEGKPVVFVAVNSGNARGDVEGFAKSTKFEWPLLVDDQRRTEKAFGVGEISLQNIYQWVVLDPEGKRQGGDVKAAIDRLLPSAKMLFEGIDVPAPLKPLARDMELGFFDGAAQVASLAAGSNKTLKEPATAMWEKLKPVAEGGLERAKALQAEGKSWLAYREYEKVAVGFKKTDYEKPAAAALAELKKQKDVKDELAAQQLLDQARKLLATGKKADVATAQQIIAAIEKKYPDSETAKEAARLK